MEIATMRCFIEISVQFNEDIVQDMQPVEEEGRSDLPTPSAHDGDQSDIYSDDPDSKFKYEDQVEPYLDVEYEDQADPDPYLSLAPNPRPKWAQKLIEYVGSNVWHPYDRR